MYKNFFGLRANPFNVNPDPRYLFLTRHTEEALACLTYGIQSRKGFVLLTGEVGTGKTTLINKLLEWLRLQQVATAFMFNSRMNIPQFLDYMMTDFGIPCDSRAKSQVLLRLYNWLLDRYRAGETAVLIIDEAQNLSDEVLEEIRMMTNLETFTEKLMQIVLVGQPELADTLRLPELGQLKQRVGLRCQIPPLTPQETREYIRTRLRIAGARDVGLFTDPAVDRISEYSGGIPRLISIVCDHCLLFAYADQKRRIDRTTVDQAVDYLEEGTPARRRVGGLRRSRAQRFLWWGLGAVTAGLTGAVLGLALRSDAALLSVVQSVRTLLVP